MSHLKLSAIDKIEVCLIIRRVVTTNINSKRGKDHYGMCCPVLLCRIGGRLHDHHSGALGGQESFGSAEVHGGVLTILVLVSMQQTVCLIFVEEARGSFCCLSCLPARVFLRSGHIRNMGDRRPRDGGREVSENHSCWRCCTSAELIMTTCQTIEFSGWFLGALFIAFCSDVWFPWRQDGCWADSSFGAA